MATLYCSYYSPLCICVSVYHEYNQSDLSLDLYINLHYIRNNRERFSMRNMKQISVTSVFSFVLHFVSNV